MSPEELCRRSALVLLVLAMLALACCVVFMTLGARGNWSFVLGFRGTRLAAMLVVAYAIAVSTVLFQTITGNRILTPAVMGFDALYVLLQTSIVFLFGAATLTGLDARLTFVAEVTLMVGFSIALYRLLFGSGRHNVHLVVLIGIVLGSLFRSLSGFLQRIISPDDFVVLQDRLFASFNVADSTLVGVSALLIGLVTIAIWRMAHVLDVMMLGREAAISLGVDHKAVTMKILVLMSVLVSISTALVGPVTFFGLLVANLAHILLPVAKHRYMLPAAVLVAVICLVGGQTVLERVFSFDTALSIIIEFAGGLFFIVFLLKGRVR